MANQSTSMLWALQVNEQILKLFLDWGENHQDYPLEANVKNHIVASLPQSMCWNPQREKITKEMGSHSKIKYRRK